MNQTNRNISNAIGIQNPGYYGFFTEANSDELTRMPKDAEILAFAGIVRPNVSALPEDSSGFLYRTEIAAGDEVETLATAYKRIIDPIKDQPLDEATEQLAETALMFYQDRAQRPGSLSYRHIGGLALIGTEESRHAVFLVANSLYRDFKSAAIDIELHSREPLGHRNQTLQNIAAAARATTVGKLVQTTIAVRMPSVNELAISNRSTAAETIAATA